MLNQLTNVFSVDIDSRHDGTELGMAEHVSENLMLMAAIQNYKPL